MQLFIRQMFMEDTDKEQNLAMLILLKGKKKKNRRDRIMIRELTLLYPDVSHLEGKIAYQLECNGYLICKGNSTPSNPKFDKEGNEIRDYYVYTTDSGVMALKNNIYNSDYKRAMEDKGKRIFELLFRSIDWVMTIVSSIISMAIGATISYMIEHNTLKDFLNNLLSLQL